MTWTPKPPSARRLTGPQYSGHACCWCNTRLARGARPAGRAAGMSGAHDLSVEVYECGPDCRMRPRRPSQNGEIE
jgi:hypothetical protein